ncbi:MAG: hypothetical protein RLZZ252_1476 [Bacteroidota bacterium]|jgi:uncharacterized OsmC-like protein
MTTASTKYLGKLRCSNVHLQSGTEILTDAPTDNQGMGSAYSPTDLCALSLTTCIITTMAIYAQGKEFQILNIEAETTKHMASDPRRIARIESHIRIELNPEADDRAKEGLKRIVPLCPVSRSLHPDVIKDVTVTFI